MRETTVSITQFAANLTACREHDIWLTLGLNFCYKKTFFTAFAITSEIKEKYKTKCPWAPAL